MKRVVGIMILALIMVACKKEPLPNIPPSTGPYYSIKGYMDGTYFHMNVGQEGILISQGTSVENGIKSYYGQIVSPSEDLLIRIEFTAPEAPLNAQGLIALNAGNVSYLVHSPGCQSASFGSNFTQFNFLQIKNELGIFQPVNEVNFTKFGIYPITMKFTDAGQSTFQVPVNYGFSNNVLNPGFTSYEIADSVQFVAFVSEFNHQWLIDGNLVSTAASFYTSLANGVHLVEHKIVDGYSNEASHSTLVRFTDYVLDWQMTMNNCTGSANPTNNYGKVTVKALTNGQEYKSDGSADNLTKFFTVSNIEYIGNSNQEPTRAVFNVVFEAELVNESGTESLSLTGMEGTFNVGLQ